MIGMNADLGHQSRTCQWTSIGSYHAGARADLTGSRFKPHRLSIHVINVFQRERPYFQSISNLDILLVPNKCTRSFACSYGTVGTTTITTPIATLHNNHEDWLPSPPFPSLSCSGCANCTEYKYISRGRWWRHASGSSLLSVSALLWRVHGMEKYIRSSCCRSREHRNCACHRSSRRRSYC